MFRTLARGQCVNCHRTHLFTVAEAAPLAVRALYRILCRACTARLTPRRSEI
jgi:hypothetical protein